MAISTFRKSTVASVITLGLTGAGLWFHSARAQSSGLPGGSAVLPNTQLSAGPQGRQYGWERLHEVLSPDGAALTWEDWSTKCDLAPGIPVDLAGNSQIILYRNCPVGNPSSLRNDVKSAEYSPQSANNPHLASVLFNSVAARSVLKNRLGLPVAGARDPLTPVAGKTVAMPGFDVNSVAVKAIWEVVNNEGTDEDPIFPFRVYDASNVMWQLDSQQQPTHQLMPVEGDTKGSGWSTKVFLDTGAVACPFARGVAPSDIELGQKVPIDCFVHYKVTDATLGAGTVKAVGHSWSGPRYFILAGLHVARKESTGWTWTTFWWTNRPSADAAHFDGQTQNLPNIAAQYLHFAMDTSVAHSGPIYNPYQEGPEGANGTISNCAQCHAYAAIRIDSKGDHVDTQANFGLPGGNLPGDYFTLGSITTDMSWTVATARDFLHDPGK
jgi:hypothetical protein